MDVSGFFSSGIALWYRQSQSRSYRLVHCVSQSYYV